MMIRKRLSAVSIFPIMAGLICAMLLFSTAPVKAASEAESSATQKAPKAFFPSTRYEFGSIMEGNEIKHDFIIENHGEAPLVISKVRPD